MNTSNPDESAALDEMVNNINQFFLVVMGTIIMFMQCGFAFLEAGSVRSKNATNILIKNALDTFISGIAYWTFGYAFAFGEKSNFFLSYWNFNSSWLDENKLAFFFYHYVFAASTATIVSGSLAERCAFTAYLVYSFCLTAFIYPVVSHWAWTTKGWLRVGIMYEGEPINYQDFAGSGAVHMVGGAAAFIGAAFLRPRIGRFSGNQLTTIRGHSLPFAALGGFILIFGFLTFNGGSLGSLVTSKDDGKTISLVIVNTMTSGSFSAIATLILNRFGIGVEHKWSLLITINGALAGMVSVCAGANVYRPWAAGVLGIFASLFFTFFSWFMTKIKVDDPLDATAVHYGGGIVGLLAVPFLGRDDGMIFLTETADLQRAGMRLLWQIVGAVSITAWTCITCSIMFGSLRLVGLLRVSEEIEKRGLDIPKHGEPAYPIEAYGHGWNESKCLMKVIRKMSVAPRNTSLQSIIEDLSEEDKNILENIGNEEPTEIAAIKNTIVGLDNKGVDFELQHNPADILY